MAYLNEFGESVSCTTSTSAQVNNFFSNWYLTLLPLALLVAIFFIIKKYVKNKLFLIIYTILAVLLYAWWLPKTFVFCA